MNNRMSSELFLVANQMPSEKEYWSDKLNLDFEKTTFDFNLHKSERKEIDFGRLEFTLPENIALGMIKQSNNSNSNLRCLITACFSLFLGKYFGKNKVVLGTSIEESEESGIALNKYLPIYIDLEKFLTYRDLIIGTRATLSEAAENQNFPLEVLIEDYKIEESEEFPLFDIGIVLENIQKVDYLKEININTIFAFTNQGNQISGCLHYNRDKYPLLLIEEIVRLFVQLLNDLNNDASKGLKDVSIFNEEDVLALLPHRANNLVNYPLDKTIPELFEKQARQNPEKIAISHLDQSITYAELEIRANVIGQRILEQNTDTKVVVLYLDRSIDTVVSMLGCLKAGFAYLPIDIDTPLQRVEYIIKDSNAKMIISNRKVLQGLGKEATGVAPFILSLDDLRYSYSMDIQWPTFSSDNLAYVIYTSGSTGNPKGVTITHRNVINILYGLNDVVFNKHDDDAVCGLIAPFIFDASIQLTFGALLFGKHLHIFANEERVEGKLLLESYNKYNINISDGTPTHLNLLVQSRNLRDLTSNLKDLIIGGDVLHIQTIKEFHQELSDCSPTITNVYGPTECTVNATYFKINPEELDQLTMIPIGKTFPNYNVAVINELDELCPWGVPGELHVGGEGVFAGYINNKQLTDEKIINNHKYLNGNVYKTGDLVTMSRNGELKFIGRKDNQVKVRGYRIELGEIDIQLLKNEAVIESVTVINDDKFGGKYLANYFVADRKVEGIQLREYLSEVLPSYMIPSYFVELTKLPLLPSGKIDRRKLPDPALQSKPGNKPGKAKNSIEEKILEIWKNHLSNDNIGVADNFFNVGGDSIKSISVLYEINEEFNMSFKIMDLYQYDTIEKFAEAVKIASENTGNDNTDQSLVIDEKLTIESIEQEIERMKLEIFKTMS